MSSALGTRPLIENRILASLPPDVYQRLAPQLSLVRLSNGQVLYEPESRIEHVYFPLTAMLSQVALLEDGTATEVGVVGFEGMSGLTLALGNDRSLHRTMAQIPGDVMRLSAAILMEEVNRRMALQRSLFRYTQSVWIHLSQLAVCNGRHSLEERLARWLLMTHDRCTTDNLPLTHEFISMMLGVRRAGVMTTVGMLQDKGLIRCTRGHIEILDRHGLEASSCECYDVIEAEFQLKPARALRASLTDERALINSERT